MADVTDNIILPWLAMALTLATYSQSRAHELTRLDLRRQLPVNSPSSYCMLSSDGRSIATTTNNDGLLIWEVATGRVRKKLISPESNITSLIFAFDDMKILGGDMNGSLHIYDLATGHETKTLVVDKSKSFVRSFGLKLSLDGKTLATCGNELILWNLHNYETIAILKPATKAFYGNVAFSRDRKTLIVVGNRDWQEKDIFYSEAEVNIWDLANRKLSRIVKTDRTDSLRCWAYFPHRERIVVSLLCNKSLSIYDLTEDKWIKDLPLAPNVPAQTFRRLIFSPSGKTLMAVGAYDGLASEGVCFAIDAATGKTIQTLRFPHPTLKTAINYAAFTPDGKTFIASGNLNYVAVYDVVGATSPRLGAECDAIIKKMKPAGKDQIANMSEKTSEELRKLWNDLLSEDAIKADGSMWKMVLKPQETVTFLGTQMEPIAAVNPRIVGELIARLDDKIFSRRELARKELEQFGDAIKPALITALKSATALESKARLRQLLDKMDSSLSVETLRRIRAVEVLERIGTPGAERLLGKLSQGLAESRGTYEAQSSLVRLAKRR